jgi:hypothetical protein
MKVTGERWFLRNRHELNAFNEWVEQNWKNSKYPTFQVMKADRSSSQNAMLHGLYGDIARQAEDLSVIDVKCMCKLHYGVPILRAADAEWSEWYDQSIKKMDYEDKLRLMTYMDVTSLFNKEQATEYIDTIIKEYTSKGYALAKEP